MENGETGSSVIKASLKALRPEWLGLVTSQSLKGDAFAGITGAAIVLPQAVAFAAIAGLPPEYGLYTAMIPPVIAAIFGSSLVMVSGPTTAISAVVFSALAGPYDPGSPEFIRAAIVLALMVGIIQVAFAIARVGRLAGFVSHSVMIGFTASAALLIAVSQMGPALGLPPSGAHGIIGRVEALIAHISDTNLLALFSAVVTLLTVILFRKYLPRWPGFLIAILFGTLAVLPFGDNAKELAYIGALPSAFPAFALPDFTGVAWTELLESGFAIALIGLLEAIAIGRSMAHRTRTDFSANQEVVGQGLSNLVGSLFQCYPGSGSFTRSGVNLESGASTPVAAIFAAVFLVIMVFVFRPLMGLVPIASVAGLILYVAYRLIDFKEFVHLLKTSARETIIAGLTFSVGLLVSLEFAIYIGTFASLAVFLGKSANPALAIGAPVEKDGKRTLKNAALFDLPECTSTLMLRLDGPLFFGSVDSISGKLRKLNRERSSQKNLILILHGVGDVDLAGVELLEQENDRRRAAGGGLFIVAHYPPLVKQLRKLGLHSFLPRDRLFDGKGLAINAAVCATSDETCLACNTRVFQECQSRPGADTAPANSASA